MTGYGPPRRKPGEDPPRYLPGLPECPVCGQPMPHDYTDSIVCNRKKTEMLHDDLADGDRHLINGPGLRRTYRIDRDTQVLSMYPRTDGGRAVSESMADRENDSYLRGLGWGD